ncbi:PilN domain-containing protein [Phormidium sp. LEGE 05292]|uniref:PilN domain-containing protein n=1 Tax=[Phormidium] sp. LEGE 05292 TaxID=767427 RepID=UPI0018805DEC|nr:PilN domain-containing protein [Phormidium sp. LEGE 05292]MBE9225814.1 PilN domain-containing protein [Phormidium sp. LEGE 05292]
MYSLDVNFLKDRPEFVKPEQNKQKKKFNVSSNVPLVAGIVVGAFLPLAVAGFWFWQQSEQSSLETQISEIQAKLDKAAKEQGELQKIRQETNSYKEQTQALASVFEQIRPWSAMVKDISERVPPGIQITCIGQIPASSTPSSTGGCQNVPNPSTTSTSSSTTTTTSAPVVVPQDKVEITGIAKSFNNVNDLILTLQRSAFLNNKETRLITAKLVDNPIKVERNPGTQQSSGSNFQVPELPKVVQFKVQTSLSDKTASQLLPQLYNLGDLGLTARIETLKEQGVIKK